jgi:hypothetical protein
VKLGDYDIEIFGWDGYNVLFNNKYIDGNQKYEVWSKFPTIHTYIDSSISRDFKKSDPCLGYLTISDVSSLFNLNSTPIFDRLVPLMGLEIKEDGEGRTYVEVPSITYFQDLPTPNSFSKFVNLTERCVSISSPTQIIIDPDYQSFLQDDSINIVLYDIKTRDKNPCHYYLFQN